MPNETRPKREGLFCCKNITDKIRLMRNEVLTLVFWLFLEVERDKECEWDDKVVGREQIIVFISFIRRKLSVE